LLLRLSCTHPLFRQSGVCSFAASVFSEVSLPHVELIPLKKCLLLTTSSPSSIIPCKQQGVSQHIQQKNSLPLSFFGLQKWGSVLHHELLSSYYALLEWHLPSLQLYHPERLAMKDVLALIL
ncbi:hypothetical protein CSUI_011155, partial [Cystoisospora suis]